MGRRSAEESLKQTPQIPTGYKILAVGDLMGKCACGNTSYARQSDVDWQKAREAEGEFYDYTRQYCGECRDRKKKEEAERKQRHFEALKRRSGIAERFLNVEWEDYQPVNDAAAKVKEICHNYAVNFEHKGDDIVMVGACGTGKNMLASLIGLHVMKDEFQFEYTTAMRLVRRIKDSWRDKETTEQIAVDSFTRPALLAIDEIGVQFGSPTEQLFIMEVINNRYEALKPTILISNLTVPQIEEVIGKRAVDRFHENGKFLVFNWDSYRRRK
jgi:DNA replication protein DnaC